MSEVLAALGALIGIAFVTGIIRGAAVCTLVCGPALCSYVASEARTWKKGLIFAIKFNIPRIALITLFGAILGYFGGILSEQWLENTLMGTFTIGYIMIGIYTMIMGFVLYRRARKRQVNLEWECTSHFKIIEKLRKKYPKIFANETTTLLVFGLIMGIVCLLEITLLDALILTTAATMFGASSGISTVFTGALTMFMFGLGSAIPISGLATLAGFSSDKVGDKKIYDYMGIIAIAIIVIGFFIILNQGKLAMFMIGAGR
jgi:cytochrome c biogenesis protein CcdA